MANSNGNQGGWASGSMGHHWEKACNMAPLQCAHPALLQHPPAEKLQPEHRAPHGLTPVGTHQPPWGPQIWWNHLWPHSHPSCHTSSAPPSPHTAASNHHHHPAPAHQALSHGSSHTPTPSNLPQRAPPKEAPRCSMQNSGLGLINNPWVPPIWGAWLGGAPPPLPTKAVGSLSLLPSPPCPHCHVDMHQATHTFALLAV